MMARPWQSLARLVAKGLFAALFVVSGVGHFVRTDTYTRIMPPAFPEPRLLVQISGAIEIALGVMLLIPTTTRFAAWGLIALLIAVFPANIYLYQHQEILPAPPILHLLRLPLQAALIFWAFAYTRRASPRPN